jgi:hypothetical protein
VVRVENDGPERSRHPTKLVVIAKLNPRDSIGAFSNDHFEQALERLGLFAQTNSISLGVHIRHHKVEHA